MEELFGAWFGTKVTRCESDVCNIADTNPDLLTRFPYALITSIDSARFATATLPSVKKVAQATELQFDELNGCLLTSGQALVSIALSQQFFNGFDEVWLLTNRPTYYPENLYIVPQHWRRNPDYQHNEQGLRLYDVVNWMKISGAMLGFADGVSLEYVTLDKTIATLLETMQC